MHNFQDLTGVVFGRLTVIKRAKNKGGATIWKCLCSCGNVKEIRAHSLVRKGDRPNTQSCGCLAAEMSSKRATTHGASRSPEYCALRSAKARCYNPNVESYPDYGGRGIRVCDRWSGERGFENFLNDLGPRPKDCSLDRIDVNGDYNPENCRWSTSSIQMKNRRKMKSLQKFSNIEFLQEYNRRFSEFEYGVSAC